MLEGIHHIFIGPDHILFIVGLLLLGGTLGRLLKIVTAFPIAHSVTLVLATLDILNPPARVTEPIFALSIVFVGAHALLHRGEKRDWRLLFAFGFGFIHGFGFANVLRDMALPRTALSWSLFPSTSESRSARPASFSRSRRRSRFSIGGTRRSLSEWSRRLRFASSSRGRSGSRNAHFPDPHPLNLLALDRTFR